MRSIFYIRLKKESGAIVMFDSRSEEASTIENVRGLNEAICHVLGTFDDTIKVIAIVDRQLTVNHPRECVIYGEDVKERCGVDCSRD